MYATEDWTSLPFITSDGSGWRLYACKCQWWEELHEHFLENDHDAPGEPDLSWVCAGHPVPTLPMMLRTFEISAQTDWAVLVRRILAGECPRPLERRDEGPWLWLTWLYAYLAGLDDAGRLSRAIAEHAHGRDDRALAAALCFFRQFPAAEGIEAVVGFGEAYPGAVLDTHEAPKNEYRPSVWDVLIAVMRKRSGANGPIDARAVALTRKVMLFPARDPDKILQTFTTYSDALRADDFAWLAENIVALEDAGRGRWIKILNLLVSVGNGVPDLQHLVVIAGIALLESGHVDATDVRAWIQRRGTERDAWVLPLLSALDRDANQT